MSKRKQIYTSTCFSCGDDIGRYVTEQGLNDALREKGWMIFENDGYVFCACSTCIKKELNRSLNE